MSDLSLKEILRLTASDGCQPVVQFDATDAMALADEVLKIEANPQWGNAYSVDQDNRMWKAATRLARHLQAAVAEVERLRFAAKCAGFEFVPVPGGYTAIPQSPQVLIAEVERLCRIAGEALSTDPSLHNSGCVQALADYTVTLRAEAERLRKELKLWKPLTPQEAEAALVEFENEPPLSEEDAKRIVERVTDPAYTMPNPERVQLSLDNQRLRQHIADLEAKAATARDEALREVRAAVASASVFHTGMYVDAKHEGTALMREKTIAIIDAMIDKPPAPSVVEIDAAEDASARGQPADPNRKASTPSAVEQRTTAQMVIAAQDALYRVFFGDKPKTSHTWELPVTVGQIKQMLDAAAVAEKRN